MRVKRPRGVPSPLAAEVVATSVPANERVPTRRPGRIHLFREKGDRSPLCKDERVTWGESGPRCVVVVAPDDDPRVCRACLEVRDTQMSGRGCPLPVMSVGWP